MNLNLIKGLEFADKLNSTEAITESGKELLKSYRGYLYTNSASYGLVNGFIAEAKNCKYDNGVATILESVLSYITENKISWKIASACEVIESSNDPYSYIAKEGCKTAEKLLSMNENEVVQYIKAGALKSIQYIPEFRGICKEVYGTTHVDEVRTREFSLTNPLSYVVMDESATWFCANGLSYCIKEGKIENKPCEDKTFNQINYLLPNFVEMDESLVYTWTPNFGEKPYTFILSESGIELKREGIVDESFNNVIDFKIYCDNLSTTMFGATRNNFMNIVSNVSAVEEGFDHICNVDNAQILECADGSVATIISTDDNVGLVWNHSSKVKCNECQTFNFMHEALDQIKTLTNCNLRSEYAGRINEDLKKEDPESYLEIHRQLKENQNAEVDRRRAKIQQLAEAYKNDPTKIAILSSISKDLSMLEN